MSSPIGVVEDRLHTVKEVAKIFSVSELTIRIWITKGDAKSRRLAAMKMGKSWRISRQAMVDWANAHYGE